MAKRSGGAFERRKNDDYRTWDRRATPPLLAHLSPGTRFIEPCAGAGDLLDQLTAVGHICAGAFDIESKRADIVQADALSLVPDVPFDCFITNPPWTREILHPLITHLSDQAPTWMLFDADWFHTKQAATFKPRLRRYVSVGRLRWIEDSKHDGKDNCAWHLFDLPRPALAPAQAYMRLAA